MPLPTNRATLLTYTRAALPDSAPASSITPNVLATLLEQIINLSLLPTDPAWTNLNAQLTSLTGTVTSLTGTVTNLTGNFNTLNNSVNNLSQSLTNGINTLNNSITYLRNDLNYLSSDLGYLKEQLSDQEQDIDELRARLKLLLDSMPNSSFTQYFRTDTNTTIYLAFGEEIKAIAFMIRITDLTIKPGYLLNVNDTSIFQEDGAQGFNDALIDGQRDDVSYAALLDSPDAASGPWKRVYLELKPEDKYQSKAQFLQNFHMADIANLTLYDRTWTNTEKVAPGMPITGIVSLYDGDYQDDKLLDKKGGNSAQINGVPPEVIKIT